jgi:hypothetical protein
MYVAVVQAVMKKETQDETLSFTMKIGENWPQFGSQLFPSVKFSFPVTCLMPIMPKLAVLAP